VIVESSENLSDWSDATILFDSRVDFPPPVDASGRVFVRDPRSPAYSRFYRVEVIEK
jgi:hypothetical protein